MSSIFTSKFADDLKKAMEDMTSEPFGATYLSGVEWTLANKYLSGGKWTLANKPTKEVKCTCGVKFTGGVCSDWCDTNNPEPDTEELPF